MNFKKMALLVLGLAPLVAAVAPVHAATMVYNWTLTGPDANLGGESVNFFSFFSQGSPPSGNAYGEEISGGGFGVGTFNLAPVPLPASWSLMLIGVGALGAFALRRRPADSIDDTVGFAAA